MTEARSFAPTIRLISTQPTVSPCRGRLIPIVDSAPYRYPSTSTASFASAQKRHDTSTASCRELATLGVTLVRLLEMKPESTRAPLNVCAYRSRAFLGLPPKVQRAGAPFSEPLIADFGRVRTSAGACDRSRG